MPAMQFRTIIQQPPEPIFDLITDLTHYDAWLAPSTLFTGVTHISDTPIKAGTTYQDTGPSATLQGVISEFSPPTRI